MKGKQMMSLTLSLLVTSKTRHGRWRRQHTYT